MIGSVSALFGRNRVPMAGFSHADVVELSYSLLPQIRLIISLGFECFRPRRVFSDELVIACLDPPPWCFWICWGRNEVLVRGKRKGGLVPTS